MASRLKIAFIGAGCVNFGGTDGPWDHATRLERIDDVNFVGIAEPNRERGEAALAKRLGKADTAALWKECKVFTDYNEMITTTKPHAVFIGVPPFCHGSHSNPMELTCVQNGVSCFVEKPLANAMPEDTFRYAEEVENHPSKVVTTVGYMFRRSKWAKYINNLVKEHGKPIVCFQASYNCAYNLISSPFWWDTTFSGGPIVEQATHFIDLARFFVGEVDISTIRGHSVPASEVINSIGHLEALPESVDETNIKVDKKVPRSTVANWKFQSGALGSLVHAALLQSDEYDANLELLADGLRIRVERPYSEKPILLIKRKSKPEERVEFPNDDAYYTEVKEFTDAVRKRLTYDNLDKADVACSYLDSAKTYFLTCKIREATSQ